MAMPVNKIIVQRLDSPALGFATMVIKIRETVADHNIILELFRALKHDYPGVWYQFQLELKKQQLELEQQEKVMPVKELIEPPLLNDERVEVES